MLLTRNVVQLRSEPLTSCFRLFLLRGLYDWSQSNMQLDVPVPCLRTFVLVLALTRRVSQSTMFV